MILKGFSKLDLLFFSAFAFLIVFTIYVVSSSILLNKRCEKEWNSLEKDQRLSYKCMKHLNQSTKRYIIPMGSR